MVKKNTNLARNLSFASNMINDIGGLAASYAQGQAIQGQAGYRVAQASINSRFASMESREILERGSRQATEHGKNIKRLVGRQKASFAAGNVLVGDGTAADVETQTREIGFEEQRDLKNNAWKQAFGIRQQARVEMLRARNAQAQADFQAKTTLVAGAISAVGGLAGSFGSFAQAGGFDSSSSSSPVKDKVAVVYDPSKYKGLA